MSSILRTSLTSWTRDILIFKTIVITAHMASNSIGVSVPDFRALYCSWAWPTLLRNTAVKVILPREILSTLRKGLKLLDGSKNTHTGSVSYLAYMIRYYSWSGTLFVSHGEERQDGNRRHSTRHWFGIGKKSQIAQTRGVIKQATTRPEDGQALNT